MGSTPPARRFDARRAVFDATSRAAEAVRGPSLRFRAPSEASVAAPCRPADPWAGSSDDTTSPGLLLPYDTVSERRRVPTAVPTAILGPHGGLAPPCATSPSSSRRAKRRSVHGLHPSGLSLRARRCLLSEALPSWRCRSPRRTVRCTQERDRLQGVALGTGPFGRRSLRIGRRGPLGVPPSRAFSPSVRAQRFGSRGLPSHPGHELTSQLGGVTGSCEAERSAWSVSGLPALVGFFTF